MKRGYPAGIPDEADQVLELANRAPAYRMICRALMKNDVGLLTLGYNREPCDAYTALKFVELRQRGVIKEYQLPLPFNV